MKRTLKWLALTTSAVLLLLAALAINVIWFRPFDIRIFYERAFLEFALQNPELLSSMRLLEQS